MRRLLVASVAVLGSCSAPPPPLALHNLERPTDMVFACVGLLPSDPLDPHPTPPTISGHPMADCHAPGQFDLPFTTTRRTFGFVTNTARGELSVIDMDNSKLVDLDPANPDTNVAPLGVLPEQISASDDGCRIVSANRGSCDLTMVDVGTLVAPTLNRVYSTDAGSTPDGGALPVSSFSRQVVVTTGSGSRLMVSPQDVLFLPQDTSSLVGKLNTSAVCADVPNPGAHPLGWNSETRTSSANGWKAVVSFPTCSLVALVDLPSGEILDSVQISGSSDGTDIQVVQTGVDPSCPTDFCDGRVPGPDGGATDADGGADGSSDGKPDGAAFTHDPYVNPTGVRPGPLALRPGGDRVYVGLSQAAFVVALDVREGTLAIPDGAKIALHEGARGVQRLRLSVDPYQSTGIVGQYGGFVGQGPQHDRQYLYAIARDNSVRIIDVSRSARLLPEIECDANIDPQFFPVAARDGDPRSTCWPADPPSPLRRPFTNGPGIRLPGVPIDVAAVDLKSTDPRNNWEGVLDGVYAFALTSTGAIFIVNIAPTLRTKTLAGITTGIAYDSPLPEVEPLVNSLRDRNVLSYVTNQDPTLGQPRLDLAPIVPSQGPAILALNTTSALDNAAAIGCTQPGGEGCTAMASYVFFPQRSAVQRQTWSVSWQGDFLGPTYSGQFDFTSTVPGTTGALTFKDSGTDFCSSGVLNGDLVTLFGCTVDAQCGPAQVCTRSDTAPDTVGTVPINGLCLSTDSAKNQQQKADCQPWLDSVRRYEVSVAKADHLILRPHLDEVVASTLGVCQFGGVVAAHTSCKQETDPSRELFTCEAVGGDPALRCVQACDVTAAISGCRPGRSCVQVGSQAFCADAPAIDGTIATKTCPLDQLTMYKVGAANAFLVQGTAPAVYIPDLTDGAGNCLANPNRLNRISLLATAPDGERSIPFCDPTLIKDVDFGTVPDLGTHLDPAQAASRDAQLAASLLDIVGVSAHDHDAVAGGGTLHGGTISSPCIVRSVYSTAETNADGTAKMDAQGQQVLDLHTSSYYALFQNRELRFVLANLEKYLGDAEIINFDVHGGFAADSVLIPGTVSLDSPARLVSSPIDSQGQSFDLSATRELPFLYVVDQRRLARPAIGAAATRGQVLRVYSRKPTGTDFNSLLPVYDDSISSANLWPIQ